jgi:thiol-disulfide isomerase/thioredoxin
MTMFSRRIAFPAFVTAVLSIAAGSVAISGYATNQTQTDTAYDEALETGRTALNAKRFEDALDAFRAANDLRKKASAEAWHGQCLAYYGLGAFKDAGKACAEGLEHVGDDARLVQRLHHDRGLALAALARKNTDKVLKEAEDEFRTVVAMPGAAPVAWYNLGAVILRQGRDEEGIATLETYLSLSADEPETVLAKRMIENPRRAREPFAEEFSFTSLGGEFIRLEDMRGKTILVDFWGMWCPPCRAATPQLVRLQQKYADEAFVLIGISSDPASKQEELLDYVDENEMAWPQYLDTRRSIHRAYQIEVFPTYIVVDGEGVIVKRVEGWNSSATFRELDSAIRKSLNASK